MNLRQKTSLLVPIAALVLLTGLHPFTDIVGGVLKPLVLNVFSVFGMETADAGDVIRIGNLSLAWTKDCEGINQFLLLLAMVLWVRRRNFWERSTLWACLFAVPAALLANLLRVITLVGYRLWFFPEVESPELHYFIGFFWLLPLACLFLPKEGRRNPRRWIELAHAASVLALLAPLVGASEGMAMGVAAVLLMAKSQVPGIWTLRRLGGMVGWILLGVGIAGVRMESFWLPWLLISPLTAKREWLRQPRSLFLLVGCHPLFDLLPLGEGILWGVVGWTLWKDFFRSAGKAPVGTKKSDPEAAAGWMVTSVAFTALIMLMAPFTAALFIPMHQKIPQPPPNASGQPLAGNGLELRFPWAPPEIGIFWYPPQNYDRHHTLKVCMKYGGVSLKPLPDHPSVWFANDLYYREFYLVDGELIDSHASYVLATLGAWASPGIHLIFIVRKEDMQAADFERTTRTIAGRLREESYGE